MASMSSGAVLRQEERRARAALWLDDLGWHKQMFKQSRFQWTGEHVMRIVTRTTGGQLTFTTVGHLRLLRRCRDEVEDYAFDCRMHMAQPLRDARTVMGRFDGPASEVPGAKISPEQEERERRWIPVARAVGMTMVECSATCWFAAGYRPKRRNINVAGVLDRLPFANPLIEVWELKQLWRMYEAAVAVFDDGMCDLVRELSDSRPREIVCEAAGMGSPGQLDCFLQECGSLRGGPGDPRRIPVQHF